MSLSNIDLEAVAATSIRDVIPQETLLAILSQPPFIPSTSLVNARDAGAVPQSALPNGRIFRCGALRFAAKDPRAISWLSINVKKVFDFRRETEREKAPDPDIPGVDNVWLDADVGQEHVKPDLKAFAEKGGAEAWGEQYISVVMMYKPTIRALLEHVRDHPEEPFLFHCTAGRDRTGVVGGMLQGLAGTPDDAIVLDYMLSRIGTEMAREQLLGFAMGAVGAIDLDEPGLEDFVSLRPEYWVSFMQKLKERFGGWDGYLTTEVGFSEQDLDTIKNNLRA